MKTDAELMALYRRGSRDAFEELFSRHHRRVVHFCYRMTGDREWADWAWTALSRQTPSSRVHNPACQFRGTHFALYFLSDASKGWKPAPPPAGTE